MNSKLIALLGFVVLASGCTSVLTSAGVLSSQNPELTAENITVSQGSDASVTVTSARTLVFGVADPNRLIDRFETTAAEPQANKITPRYNTEDPAQMNNSTRIGWIAEWQNTVNATVELPVNTSQEPGVYRYSLVAVNKGKTDALDLQINITE